MSCYTRLLALIALVMLVASGHAFAQTDYDTDDDNLIEIGTHARLNAVRWDLNGDGVVADTDTANYNAAFSNPASGMGCPSTCQGYELTAHINLDTNGDNMDSSADTYWNNGQGWIPIGDDTDNSHPHESQYHAIFKGNGYTIQNLFINRAAADQALFGGVSDAGVGGRIESLGVTNADVTVTGASYVGILVSTLRRGDIVACYTSGSVSSTTGSNVGGLVGLQLHENAEIKSSYSTASVTAFSNGGGLVGSQQGGNITDSYATGSVIRASGTDENFGGLVGAQLSASVTNSYWDTQTTGRTTSAGTGATGYMTTQLQSPTTYTGIYANWNANLDGVAGNDDPWDFGGSSAYPTLVYHHTDYDRDEDGLIDIASLAQLNAIRWNLNGRGDSGNSVFIAAFPNRITTTTKRMGCPAGTCTGYELVADLDFDENGDGSITQAGDPTYWNGGEGFEPIGTNTGPYNTTFEGNGYTISNLYINRSRNYSGFFGATDTLAYIRSLGLVNATIAGGQGTVGALVGLHEGRIAASYVTGSVTANTNVGGLVGGTLAGSHIVASYAMVQVVCNQTGSFGTGAGLAGYNNGTIASSYSLGTVTGACANKHGLTANAGTVTASYWDTQQSRIADDSDNAPPEGKTVADLQSVTSASGIYADWDDLTIDATGTNDDDPWTFGTADQYPALNFAGLNTTVQFQLQPPGVPTGVTVTPIEMDTLVVRWTAASQATGYKVQWKSGMQSYDASRQATTTTETIYKIPDLTAGTIYTIRVIATKTGVSDGPPSAEVRGRPGTTTYDTDGDNYIDVTTLAQLNAIRYDLNSDGMGIADSDTANYNAAFPNPAPGMGCPVACTGYELLASLDFDSDGDGAITSADAAYWNGGAGWIPIGSDASQSDRFSGDFKGNGYTINNLFINRTTAGAQGLFGAVHSTSRIETLGIINASVTAGSTQDYHGILAGTLYGEVVACYTTGAVSGRDEVGGLVGIMGTGATPAVNASYSTASVSGTDNVGGLVGRMAAGSITTSYSTGSVSGTTNVGGLLGSGSSSNVSDSYWNTSTSGQTTSAAGTGYTTAELQSVTGYTGIYANWNANLDGVMGNDDPWNLGTNKEYPVLKYGGHNAFAQGGGGDYDRDNDGYIDVENLAQLAAINHDLDGNGVATHPAYAAAFPNRATAATERMGCPSGTCTGYELLANLDFDENGDGAVDASDHGGAYWNGGAG